MVDDRLRKTILDDEYNALVFEFGERHDVHVVGGYLRDIILGREIRDRDYAVGRGTLELAQKIATHLGCKVIQFTKRPHYRIILGNQTTLDFTPVDRDISHDLAQRDFTLNSLAWSPQSGLIDQHNALEDIKYGLLHIISPENISIDPVRIVRAYRFCGELGFTIEENTRNILIKYNKLLKIPPSERITLEFFRILNSERCSSPLFMMKKDGVLSEIIHLNYIYLERFCEVLDEINGNINKLPLINRLKFQIEFSQGLTFAGFTRLASLTRYLPFPHRLSLSQKILKASRAAREALECLENTTTVSEAVIYCVFSRGGDIVPGIISIAGLHPYIEEYERFQQIIATPVISSEEIFELTGLPASKKRRDLIYKIRELNFTGKIRSYNDAVRYLNNLKNNQYNII